MSRHPHGNTALKAARQHAGYSSQQAFVDALNRAAPRIGLSEMEVSVRQVRRWESNTPPWPRTEHQRLLVHVLQLPVERLGFTPPWEVRESTIGRGASAAQVGHTVLGSPLPQASKPVQPATIGADYSMITAAHRRMYSTVQPDHLHPAVVEHTRLGLQLLAETSGVPRRVVSLALAESLLIAGRIEFFDLRQPDAADATFVHALQAAGEANDSLLGSAILAHAAFIPGWANHPAETANRLRAARTYARRGSASAEFVAWIYAVEAECHTRCGQPGEALAAIASAEAALASEDESRSPEWFTWFSGARLVAFKGNIQLLAGRWSQARDSLTEALTGLEAGESKQRAVVLADLAAVEVAAAKPMESCKRLHEALDQLAITWYATGMERVRKVREGLQPWADSDEVQSIDDRLYGWSATLNALRG
ncbi:hypothetical protein [Actinoplanes derwentensis]|uniref:Transcriptional regulator n=1 Tax=Actinoplanes derwentensis TaxID=113562 RepID=A0A1H2CVB4_9ACTN|nr:hypothetical protein [Actinoplanes derwentensis]GID82048.1 hypothetical protein Ade03nite_09720 [Actinoplanes derwentensis]SDT74468.1 hypothetical protein SAMN04489716_6991 [Actinoplanes derwentensis]